ncbi:hypothetical protein C1646_749866 [Rhizophagus diaphanus]|nr:hypothetical protein C1646_749866 [Rhizophagus diaphanus] [Rhizophagus sp. MUCL 43196]
MKKLSLNDACIIAESHGGICLSTEYKDNKTHYYGAVPRIIYGMPHFVELKIVERGNARLTLENAKQIAFSRNGEYLLTTYRNSKTPMTWKCHQGHIWNIPLNNIKNSGSWCPYCAGHMKLTLEDAKQIALSRHGKCLSTEYKNIAEPLTWRCQSNHQWQNSLNHIKNGG